MTGDGVQAIVFPVSPRLNGAGETTERFPPQARRLCYLLKASLHSSFGNLTSFGRIVIEIEQSCTCVIKIDCP